MTTIRYLSTADVAQLLEPRAVLAALAEGFKALSAGTVQAPPRPKVDVPHKGFGLAMLAWMPESRIRGRPMNRATRARMTITVNVESYVLSAANIVCIS